MEWLTWKIEIYVCVMTHLNDWDTCICMIYTNDRNIQICDDLHEWQYIVVYINDRNMLIYDDLHDWWKYMDIWWLTWMTGIYMYVMIYMSDKDMWICYELHKW